MDEGGYLAEALFERLRDGGIDHCVLEPGAQRMEIAVGLDALAGMPRFMARFSQELDLRLVQLTRPQPLAWRFVFAWSDELGRSRFLVANVCSDWYRSSRRLLTAEELLSDTPDVRFAYRLLDGVDRQDLGAERTASLHALWSEHPAGAMQAITRFWPRATDVRLLGQAAKRDEWFAVRSALPALRRALHRTLRPHPRAVLARIAALGNRALAPERVAIGFVGPSAEACEHVKALVLQDLASGLRDIVVVQDRNLDADLDIQVDASKPLPAVAAEASRKVLRWLETRVERRYPAVLAGEIPPAARWLQFAGRHRVPLLLPLLETLLHCRLRCRLDSPILMPNPYGIVIEEGVRIGSRVTLYQHVAIGAKRPGDEGRALIEDNVTIGAGAKILGAVRIGRGATVGANAVVTRDVPSHCTVVGANRILGATAVVQSRQPGRGAVVNT